MKQPRPEDDSQTIDTYHCRNTGIGFKIIDILLESPAGWEPVREEVIASQKPNALPP